MRARLVIVTAVVMPLLLGTIAVQSQEGPQGQSEVPPTASAWDILTAVPLCTDAPVQNEEVSIEEIPTGPTTYMTLTDTSTFWTTILEASERLPWLRIPSSLPAWVGCQVAEVNTDSGGGGYLALDLFSGTLSAGADQALHYHNASGGPSSMPPLDGGTYSTLTILFPKDGTNTTVYSDDSFGTGTGLPPNGGTRLVWKNSTDRYFDMYGAVSLTEAQQIAASVEPAF